MHKLQSGKSVHLSGWKRQSYDARDEAYRVKLHPKLTAAPARVDLRSICSGIEDQSDLGACTANAAAGIVEAEEIHEGAKLLSLHATGPSVAVGNVMTMPDGTIQFTTTVKPDGTPKPPNPPPPAPTPPTPPAPPAPPPAPKFVEDSRLFTYYCTRMIEGTVSEDSGASIRDTLKSKAQYGSVAEFLWPYDISKFAVKPPDVVFAEALKHRITSYHSISDGDLGTMKSVLAAGYLIEFGFDVYSYFLSDDMTTKAFLDMPLSNEQIEGGHAVDLVGYDDLMINPFNPPTPGAFLARNSWGIDWGINGYFWISYAYIGSRLASDFWCVQKSPYAG